MRYARTGHNRDPGIAATGINAYDTTIWCLFLTAFFLMIRKSNLVPNSAKTFQSQKQLIRKLWIICGFE
jgi:hypothetical protein